MDKALKVPDPLTGLLKVGYGVLERDEQDSLIIEAHFLPLETHYYEKGKFAYLIHHGINYPLLVSIIHRQDAVRPFGRSRIYRRDRVDFR